MIRKSTININNANTGKLDISDDILHEYNRVVNMFISHLWDKKILKGSFVRQTSFIPTWLSARMRQAAAKQALAIVKSQRRKKKKNRTESFQARKEPPHFLFLHPVRQNLMRIKLRRLHKKCRECRHYESLHVIPDIFPFLLSGKDDAAERSIQNRAS